MDLEFDYYINQKTYKVLVTYKEKRNISYRFQDGHFLVSAPYYTRQKRIIQGLDKFAEKLINRDAMEKPKGNDYIYLLGEKYPTQEEGIFQIDTFVFKYKNKEQFDKKIKQWFLSYVTERVRLYEEKMYIKPYNVHVRNMTSRYGSNSKQTRSLCFSLILMHYSLDIIDSVVVHELAHDFEFNHSDRFYKVVYKYCPKYDMYHTKLRKGEFR